MKVKVAFWKSRIKKVGDHSVETLLGHVIWDEETNEIFTSPSDDLILTSFIEDPQMYQDEEGHMNRWWAKDLKTPAEKRKFVEMLSITYGRGTGISASAPEIQESNIIV